ncbi:MAG: hypothetical protein U0736_03850 [Gemmataceae bacterium]
MERPLLMVVDWSRPARVVTVAYGFWDTHGQNFRHLKQHLPLFDQGIRAIEDIYGGPTAPPPSSSGASSAVLPRSTRTPAATTGRGSSRHPRRRGCASAR